MEIVRVEIVGRLPLRPLDLGQPEARLDSRDHAHGDAILQLEYVSQIAVEPFRPDVPACGGLDELPRNARPLSPLSDRALEQIADAEFAPDLTRGDGLVLIDERGVPCDDEQPPDPAQRCDDVLDDAVREIVRLRIAAHVLERQHCDRGFFGRASTGSGFARAIGSTAVATVPSSANR